jgi:serine/threonine protein phosphatase PrpC
VKTCPKCGASGGDVDVFCELDGARLVGDGRVVRPCAACGLADADAGDGYCSACGHGLGPASTKAVVKVGAKIGCYEVVSPSGADEHSVRATGDGPLHVLVLGEARDLEAEAAALQAVAACHSAEVCRLVEQGADGAVGAFLVRTTLDGGRPLAEVAAGLALPAVVALASAAVDVADALCGAGFLWSPRPGDFGVKAGALTVSRLRVARKSTPAPADVRAVLEAVGSSLLPMPAALGPARLGRLLATRTPGAPDRAIDVRRAREEIARITPEIDPPSGPHALAELCDAGLRRDHNEDSTATAHGTREGEPWAVLVVCDGVSSSMHADEASSIATRTTRDVLAHFLRSGDVAFESLQSAMAAAVRAAHVAICATPFERDTTRDDRPGTTIVAAVVFQRRIIVGWVGDSRAYWVTEAGAELITRDHSWVNETVDAGEMTEAEAMAAPLAHALTRCLGPLESDEGASPDVVPDVRMRHLGGAGDVVLCTDGLWNYFSPAAEVAAVVRAAGKGASAGLIARCLVNHALWRGGGDNVSVAVYKHA